MFKILIYWMFMLLPLIALGGCGASISAYPTPTLQGSQELKVLSPYLGPEQISAYDNLPDENAKRQLRNKISYSRLYAVDIRFHEFESRLFEESALSSTGADWAVLGLNAATTVVGGTATKAALGAASTGLVGAKAAFDKNTFFDRSIPAIIAAMHAARQQALVPIMQGLAQDTSSYPLQKALIDIEVYNFSGSIPGALSQISVSSGAEVKQANIDLDNIMTVGPVEASVQNRKVAAANIVRELNDQQRSTLAHALKVSEKGDIEENLIDKVNTLNTASDLNSFSQHTQILFGKAI